MVGSILNATVGGAPTVRVIVVPRAGPCSAMRSPRTPELCQEVDQGLRLAIPRGVSEAVTQLCLEEDAVQQQVQSHRFVDALIAAQSQHGVSSGTVEGEPPGVDSVTLLLEQSVPVLTHHDGPPVAAASVLKLPR